MKSIESNKLRFAYTSVFALFSLYAFLRLWPITEAVYRSFTNFNLFKTDSSFIGFDNYVKLFTRDRSFLNALRNTLVFAFSTASVSLVLAFCIALMLTRRKLYGAGLFQALLFLPVVISVVPSAIIWKWIYDPQYGILNFIITRLGGTPVGWLVDAKYSMLSVVIFVVWKWLGYYMVIFIVGLANIPRDYIQAAVIDGAGRGRLLTGIIIPLTAPILLFAGVMATIRGFTAFSEIYVMTVGSQGAPGNTMRVIAFDIYERAFLYGKIGEANAEALVLFVILGLFTLLQVKVRNRSGV